MTTQTITQQDQGAHIVPAFSEPEWIYTSVNYYKDTLSAAPTQENSTLTEHELRLARRSDDGPNVDKRQVRIRNIAGHEAEYSIQTHGFSVETLRSAMQHDGFRNDDILKKVYFPEITALLKRTTGAKQVFQYEWHVRSGTLEQALSSSSSSSSSTKGQVDINGPVRRVHIDETPRSAKLEFAHHVLSQAQHAHLKDCKFGIYNVWKPLKTVGRDPLTLCDSRTVLEEDSHVGRVHVPAVGEIENFAIKAPPGEGKGERKREHGFVFVKGQRVEQALIFRIYDGRVDDDDHDDDGRRHQQGEEGIGRKKRSHGVAHTSFVEPGTEGNEARESVEVRSFCVF